MIFLLQLQKLVPPSSMACSPSNDDFKTSQTSQTLSSSKSNKNNNYGKSP